MAQTFYTEGVISFIEEHVTSQATFERIEHVRTLIEEFPEIGRVYDPEYAAARPPFPCRFFIVPDTPFTLYYTYDAQTDRVIIFALEFMTGNPARRFEKLG